MITIFKTECPFAWWEFIQQFEGKKRTWVESKSLTVPLSNILALDKRFYHLQKRPLKQMAEFERKKKLLRLP